LTLSAYSVEPSGGGPAGLNVEPFGKFFVYVARGGRICSYNYCLSALDETAAICICNVCSNEGFIVRLHHATVFPTPEDAPFPVQTSLYGASKLAGEGLISAYCEGFGFSAWIFRFVSILGERYTHGHVFDFYKRLLDDPTHLHVLGNGKQRKSYLYVQDCVDAIFTAIERGRVEGKAVILNLGTDEYCEVTDSIGWITGALGITPRLTFAGGDRGWIGDSPFILLDCSRMRRLGWAPTLTIREGILRTLAYLRANPWVLEART